MEEWREGVGRGEGGGLISDSSLGVSFGLGLEVGIVGLRGMKG